MDMSAEEAIVGASKASQVSNGTVQRLSIGSRALSPLPLMRFSKYWERKDRFSKNVLLNISMWRQYVRGG